MKILRATHLGMCFGVRDAIALAVEQASKGSVTVLGELVHNETVLADLRAKGVRVEPHPQAVSTETAIITAHGASDKMMAKARAQGLNLIEATCPLVHFAHRSLRQLVEQGYHPVVIGKRDHVEVRGLTEDFVEVDIILCEDDVRAIKARRRFGVVAQTTQPIARVRTLVTLLRERFADSEVRFIDTVCQPTKQRQSAAAELAQQCDVVIVVGGEHSNNTRELVATCREFCSRVYHVQTAANLCADWFNDANVAGITAGTSTPDATIQDVEDWIDALRRERVADEAETCSSAS
jgi:4-hydroxy-3-methylbut-2-en-1-yl diphosphate reductase